MKHRPALWKYLGQTLITFHHRFLEFSGKITLWNKYIIIKQARELSVQLNKYIKQEQACLFRGLSVQLNKYIKQSCLFRILSLLLNKYIKQSCLFRGLSVQRMMVLITCLDSRFFRGFSLWLSSIVTGSTHESNLNIEFWAII